MPTKRAQSAKRTKNFHETLAMPMSRPFALPVAEARKASKLSTIVLAVVAAVAIVLISRSMFYQAPSQATPAGSIVMSSATAADAQLQVTQPTDSFQATGNGLQAQTSSNLQAYSDAANLQGGIPAN